MRVSFLLVSLACATGGLRAQTTTAGAQPNILVLIADDWSAPHAGFLGDATVRTPNFDRLAAEGVTFTRAFVSSPSCTPSRAALLTGRHATSLGAGANLYGPLDTAFANYVTALAAAGYHVGMSRKGWGPGRYEEGGYAQNPAGPAFEDFDAFLAARPPSGRATGPSRAAPWCYWFGTHDPHRAYEPGSGAAAGLSPGGVSVPACWPDVPAVRSDVLDYYAEVERFDREAGEILERLRRSGELDNTLVILTSDNGMPFPRGKANLYDLGTHVPLVLHWPTGGVSAGGRVDSALVSLIDLAPTILMAAGLPVPSGMQGSDLGPMLRPASQTAAQRKPTARPAYAERRAVFFGRERHANIRLDGSSYPMRAIRTAGFLYVRNFAPDHWPAGDPEVVNPKIGPFGDVDNSPTKRVMLVDYGDPTAAYRYNEAFGRRPAEELYDLATDPDQMRNVATDPAYLQTLLFLRQELATALYRYGDPRSQDPDTEVFTRYPYTVPIGYTEGLGRDW